MKKKILSMALAFIMLLSLFPVSALAAESTVEPLAEPAAVVTAGQELTATPAATTAKIGNQEYGSLSDAISNVSENATVTLLANETLAKSIDISKSLTLDLNGHTVTGLTSAYSIRIAGADVVVKITDSSDDAGGKITSARNDEGGVVQVASGAKLILEHGTIEATGASGGCPVLVMGQGAIANDTQGAAFEMNGGHLKATGYYALAGNGLWDTTTITISGGVIESSASGAIYHPQEGTLTLNGGTISGTTGVQICGGSLVIPEESTVKITGTGSDNRANKTGDGLIDDGAAVSIVSRGGGYGDVKAKIGAGSFTSKGSEAVMSYVWANNAVDSSGNPVKDFISGGEFSDLSALAYATTSTAIEIELSQDVTTKLTYEIQNDVTLNLNGHTVKGENVRAFHVKSGKLTMTGTGTVTTVAGTTGNPIAASSSVIRVGDADKNTSAAELVIGSGVTINAPATYGVTVFGKNANLTLDVAGTVEATGPASAISGNGSQGLTATSITIEDGAKVTASGSAAIYQPQQGTLTIKNGAEVSSTNGAGIAARSGSVVIEGGEITGGGTGNFTVGDSTVELPKSAVVYDSSANYPGVTEDASKLTISGGTFTADDGVSSVSAVAPEGGAKKITISGGTFMSNTSADTSVKDYLAPGFQLNSSGTVGRIPSSGGGTPTSSTTTTTQTNPDGSTTTTVTDKKTGTVTETTKKTDGTTVVVETKKDGTVTAKTTQKDGAETVSVKKPDGETAITVSSPAGETIAKVNLPSVIPAGKAYSDVESGDWFNDSVSIATGLGLFSGTSKNTFSPEAELNRGMLVTVLHRLSGTTAYGVGEHVFSDVAETAWYADAADWAYAAGVANGTGTGFAPKQSITRQDMVAMIYRYAKTIGIDPSAGASLSAFSDGTCVESYAQEAMQWAVSAGLISGKGNGVLDPTGTATRAEVAAVLVRFVEYLSK